MASTTNSLRTTRPSGPVCLVTSVWPSIAPAVDSASSAVRHSLTPPWSPDLKVPFPRPPAWIWDLRTTAVPASAQEPFGDRPGFLRRPQASPLGKVTPYWERS